METPPSLRTNGCTSQVEWRGIFAVIGGTLVHLSLGTLYTFGNLNPYLTSFMRYHGSDPTLTYQGCSWIFALACMGQGTSMFLGGIIERRIGPRLTTLMGGWFMSLGVMLTFFSIKWSFMLTVITYGFMFGLGVGLAYAVPLGCAMRWFPEHKGLVNGFVVAGFGGGAFIFNQVQTWFINPENGKVDQGSGTENYFVDPGMMDRVPYVFLLLGGCYAGMQLLGSLMLSYPDGGQGTYSYTMQKKGMKTRSQTNEEDHALILSASDEDNSSAENASSDQSPKEVLHSWHFYLFWFMFLCNGQGSVFISSMYKAYGQTFISDDLFLSLVGAFAAIFNAFGRILWGLIADRWSCRVALLIMCCSFTCLMLTLQLSEYGGKPIFFLYVCLLFGCFSGSFALFPTATAKCFGHRDLSINYGLIFTSQTITAPLGVFLSDKLKSSIGWTGLFFLVSGFSFLSFALNVFIPARDKKGREI